MRIHWENTEPHLEVIRYWLWAVFDIVQIPASDVEMSLILSPGFSDTSAGPPHTYVHRGVLHWQFRPSEIENKRHDIDWASFPLVSLLSPNYKHVSVSRVAPNPHFSAEHPEANSDWRV